MEGFMTAHLTADSKERKGLPVTTGCFHYFPLAIAEIARLSKHGNDKHNPGQPLHWSRDKSNDHLDCVGRHLLEVGTVDDDGFLHDTMLAWRALANLQVVLEARQAAAISPKDTVAWATHTHIQDHDQVRASFGQVSEWMTRHQFDQMEMAESGLRIDMRDPKTGDIYHGLVARDTTIHDGDVWRFSDPMPAVSPAEWRPMSEFVPGGSRLVDVKDHTGFVFRATSPRSVVVPRCAGWRFST
jgi:hypothetical protein